MIQVQEPGHTRNFTNLQDVAAYYAWKHRHTIDSVIALPSITITDRFIHVGEIQYARIDQPAQAV